MAKMEVQCPVCKSTNVIKHGVSTEGKQRYQCKNTPCNNNTFILNYSYAGRTLEIKTKIIEMAINGNGIRDTARVLGIGCSTVIAELKKKRKFCKT